MSNEKKNKMGMCYLDKILTLNAISPWTLSLQLVCLCYFQKLSSFNKSQSSTVMKWEIPLWQMFINKKTVLALKAL